MLCFGYTLGLWGVGFVGGIHAAESWPVAVYVCCSLPCACGACVPCSLCSCLSVCASPRLTLCPGFSPLCVARPCTTTSWNSQAIWECPSPSLSSNGRRAHHSLPSFPPAPALLSLHFAGLTQPPAGRDVTSEGVLLQVDHRPRCHSSPPLATAAAGGRGTAAGLGGRHQRPARTLTVSQWWGLPLSIESPHTHTHARQVINSDLTLLTSQLCTLTTPHHTCPRRTVWDQISTF